MIARRVIVQSAGANPSLFWLFKAVYPVAQSNDRPFEEHHHTQLEISLILTGKGVYECSGVAYAFRPGDVFFHCGGDNHSFREIKAGSRLSLLVCQFEPRLLWSLGNDWFDSKVLQLFMKESQIKRHLPEGTEIAEAIAGLLHECFQECVKQKPAYELIAKAKLLVILGLIVRQFTNEMTEIPYRISEQNIRHVERSMNYLLDHLDENLTLDDLAKEAQMSRSYYSSLFKTMNGVSVWSYITNQRIRKAQQLLETTEMSVTNIATVCGFNTLANFNRSFRQQTGESPTLYRRQCSVQHEELL